LKTNIILEIIKKWKLLLSQIGSYYLKLEYVFLKNKFSLFIKKIVKKIKIVNWDKTGMWKKSFSLSQGKKEEDVCPCRIDIGRL
jgi:hypothetical protein